MIIKSVPRSEDDRALKALALWVDGRTGTEIARELNYPSRNAVIGMVNRIRNDDATASAPFESKAMITTRYRL